MYSFSWLFKIEKRENQNEECNFINCKRIKRNTLDTIYI